MHAASLAVLQRFYQALQRGDGEVMAACYHPQARFHDPVFGTLQGAEVGDMWRMLCARAEGLQVTFQVREATAQRARVDWQARYRFSRSGRWVNNRIRGEFVLRDGLIVEHRDHFAVWRWARQALGAPGWWLGWTPWLQGQVCRQARAGLAAWRASAAPG